MIRCTLTQEQFDAINSLIGVAGTIPLSRMAYAAAMVEESERIPDGMKEPLVSELLALGEAHAALVESFHFAPLQSVG